MSKITKNKNNVLYFLACIAIFIFLIAIFSYDRATDTRQQQSAYAVTHWTDYKTAFNTKKTVISGTITIDPSVGNVLAFYSVHQNIKFYVGSRLIYEYPVDNNNPLSDSPGYCWNFINLPFNNNDIEMVITSPYPPYLRNIPDIYIGNAFSLPAHIITRISFRLRSASSCLCSVLYCQRTICSSPAISATRAENC